MTYPYGLYVGQTIPDPRLMCQIPHGRVSEGGKERGFALNIGIFLFLFVGCAFFVVGFVVFVVFSYGCWGFVRFFFFFGCVLSLFFFLVFCVLFWRFRFVIPLWCLLGVLCCDFACWSVCAFAWRFACDFGCCASACCTRRQTVSLHLERMCQTPTAG